MPDRRGRQLLLSALATVLDERRVVICEPAYTPQWRAANALPKPPQWLFDVYRRLVLRMRRIFSISLSPALGSQPFISCPPSLIRLSLAQLNLALNSAKLRISAEKRPPSRLHAHHLVVRIMTLFSSSHEPYVLSTHSCGGPYRLKLVSRTRSNQKQVTPASCSHTCRLGRSPLSRTALGGGRSGAREKNRWL